MKNNKPLIKGFIYGGFVSISVLITWWYIVHFKAWGEYRISIGLGGGNYYVIFLPLIFITTTIWAFFLNIFIKFDKIKSIILLYLLPFIFGISLVLFTQPVEMINGTFIDEFIDHAFK